MKDLASAARKYIGRNLGTVTIIKPIGQGANGAVFAGFQRTLRRQVAVKILPKHKQTTDSIRDSFHHEAELVAALSHPGIMPIFEMGEADDCYFQVFQLAQGSDLETIIENRVKNPLPNRQVLSLTRSLTILFEVLDALGYAHEEGVIHQDIKPANVLIEKKTKRALIADFGIARTTEAESDENVAIVGSPLYMAPERLSSLSLDPRSDIYSVGMMFFKMLTGILPLKTRESMDLLKLKASRTDSMFTMSPAQSSDLIDESLERILLKSMAYRAEDRFGNCSEFAGELRYYCLKQSINLHFSDGV